MTFQSPASSVAPRPAAITPQPVPAVRAGTRRRAGGTAARRTRALLRQLHLWMGLVIGLPFALLGLTGSALVFYVEIDALLTPEIRAASEAPAPDWSSPAWDRALATVQAAWPDRIGKWTFEANGEPGAIPARFYEAAGVHGHGARPLMVWVSADGSRVVRHARWGDYLMTWFYDVHRNLLAGDTGNRVVGWLGVAMLLLLATGMAAWWPRGSWRKALAFRRAAPPLRRLRDLHKLLGLSTLALLFVLTATGALLALPAERDLLLDRTVAPVVPVPAPVSAPPSGRRIAIVQALAAARQALPDARLAWIDVPGAPEGVFRLRVQVPGDPNRRFPQSYVFVDQYSGTVLAVHDMRRGTASTTAAAWLRPLHDASVGGLATRILGVVVGLVPAALFLTGLLRWRRRRAAASVRPVRPSEERTNP
ncbi:PepSY-associated TM helix domain-containing protein [Sphingosinicella terrae]|uniref:PepSY-associated TM helix domain-containing protein n=1 Tax=Sphingosinicella terrae TaxID=2172047 RepID=UPI002547F07A|nr:PepSY-associated TM helix domain-containing protein [Sphingosinicella terrae]